MSAQDHLSGHQFHQLPMFMSAHEIQHTHATHDFGEGYPDPTNEGWGRKIDEAHERGGMVLDSSSKPPRIGSLYDHIRERGVTNPVTLSDPTTSARYPSLFDGHHRVAVMAETRPHDLMPVVHKAGFGK